ncbi:hypothetical protein CR513_23583, partial [Mucuna pruriens]
MWKLPKCATHGNSRLHKLQSDGCSQTIGISHDPSPCRGIDYPLCPQRTKSQNVGMLRKITHTWGNIVKKGMRIGTKEPLYHANAPKIIEKVPILDIPRKEETEELGEVLLKSKEEKKGLKKRLEEAYEKQRISLEETEEKRKSLEKICKRAKIEENNLRTNDYLRAPDQEMGLRREERDRVLAKKTKS